MKTLQSRATDRVIRVETSAEPGHFRVIIRHHNYETSLSFTEDVIEQHSKLVCSALDRKMDTLLAGAAV